MKRLHAFLAILLVLLIVSVTSCTYFRPNQAKVQAKVDERVKELTSGAKISTDEAKRRIKAAQALLSTVQIPTNPVTPVTINQPVFKEATNEVDAAAHALGVTADLLRRNENVVGKPLIDQTPAIMALLSENRAVRESAEAKEKYREKQESGWRAKVEELERKLVEYGTKYEQERNDKITSWVKWGSIALLAIGGPIALMVLFPPFAGFLVGIFPALGHIFGVPVSMAKNVIKGVGNTQWELKQQIASDQDAAGRVTGYTAKTYTAQEVLSLLSSNLHTALDSRDKAIVDHFKPTQNV